MPLFNRQLKVLGTSLVIVALTGCFSDDFPTCQSQKVSHPSGRCNAYYYQTDYLSGGATTQALVFCSVAGGEVGGNVVAFHNLKTGIGLRWLDAQTLEVAVPMNVKLEDQQFSSTYRGHKLQFRYRPLQANEPAALGCELKIRSGI